MSSLLDAPPPNNATASYVAIAGTVAAHAAIVLLAAVFGTRAVAEVRKLLPVTEMVNVDLPEQAPPPPEPVKPTDPPPTQPRAHVAAPEPTPPPPAAAQAGQILDAKSDVVDFGDTMVVGSGDTYAGGVTDSQGTSKAAVQDSAARGGVPGTAKAVAAPTVDLSRPPQLAGGARWDCPFPFEADDAGMDHAVVTLRIDVGADGSVQRVSILKDPGSGFGREARRCATSKRWQSGLDRAGHPASATSTVNVHFDR
jgi:protein TonB